MVWNRRATKKGGRVNPPDAWVWSTEPTHEPIITRETFEAAAAVPRVREGSRSGAGLNEKHPETKRSYVLRSYVICDVCGCRIFGKTNRAKSPYYVCQPSLNLGADAVRRHPNHPPTVWVREDALLDGIAGFFNDRVFGPRRKELLKADFSAIDDISDVQERDRIRSLAAALKRIESRQGRLIRKLEMDDDPEGVLFRQVRKRLAELEEERVVKLGILQELQAKDFEMQPPPMELLDRLPLGEIALASAPAELLRLLFEACRLEVRFNRLTNEAACRVTIDEGSVVPLCLSELRTDKLGSKGQKASRQEVACTDALRAPGRVRNASVQARPALSGSTRKTVVSLGLPSMTTGQ
jgi:site-specific DNA recombinase